MIEISEIVYQIKSRLYARKENHNITIWKIIRSAQKIESLKFRNFETLHYCLLYYCLLMSFLFSLQWNPAETPWHRPSIISMPWNIINTQKTNWQIQKVRKSYILYISNAYNEENNSKLKYGLENVLLTYLNDLYLLRYLIVDFVSPI